MSDLQTNWFRKSGVLVLELHVIAEDSLSSSCLYVADGLGYVKPVKAKVHSLKSITQSANSLEQIIGKHQGDFLVYVQYKPTGASWWICSDHNVKALEIP